MSGMRRAIGVVSSAILGLVPAVVWAPAASAVHVTCGQTILVSTVLDSDLNCPTGHGVVIGADNITFDLGGHTITGGGPTVLIDSAGVYLPNRAGVTVRNGTVTNFNAGVAIDGGSGNTVTRMNVVGNTALRGDFGEGIGVYASNNNTLRENVLEGNGPFAGITLLAADSNTVDRNTIRNNTLDPVNTDGIRLENVGGASSDFNTVTDNLVQNNALDGIALFAGSSDNVLRGNFTTQNKRDGITVFAGSARNVIERNVASGNGFGSIPGYGIFVRGPAGRFGPTIDNQILGNRAFSNNLGDFRDGNGNCDLNDWHGNSGTVGIPPCTLQP